MKEPFAFAVDALGEAIKGVEAMSLYTSSVEPYTEEAFQNGSAGLEQLMPWSSFIQKHCTGLIDVETITLEEHPELLFD